jgi:hypothetical protein
MKGGVKGPLVVLEFPGGKGGGLNSTRYQEQVLDGALLDFYEKLYKERNEELFVMQDNARSHTSKSTRAWFERHNIPLFPHPPKSPNLIPIELVWHLLKHNLQNCEQQPTNEQELKQAVLEAWDAITAEEIDRQMHMESRMQAVIAANGGPTRY